MSRHLNIIPVAVQAIDTFWQLVVDTVWGLPMVVLIAGASVYFAVLSRLLPFQGLGHAFELLRGRYRDPAAPGEISHFQALASALSGTVGMGNIAGVAVAISLGGPGAVFWMWLAGLLGMITKFSTCTLACLYRHEDVDGIAQGGPMYFIEYGLGPRFRPLAVMFAVCGLVGCLPLFQTNQVAGLLHAEWDIAPLYTGIAAAAIVAISILGGIRRIGRISARLVPSMFFLYLGAGLFIIATSRHGVPELLWEIISSAFGTGPVVGGAAGLTFRDILVTGVRRAVFSNEAGVGTEALAHGAARTREPVREGLVAMLGPVFDTHIICTLTSLVILSADVDTGSGGIVMAAQAFRGAMPRAGGFLLTIIVILFAASTMITLSYYSLKCARYLFGKRMGNRYIYVYLLLIPVAAVWSQSTIINIMDSMFALMAIPTLIASILLAPRVVAEARRYFAARPETGARRRDGGMN